MKQRRSIFTVLGVLAVILLLIMFCPIGLSIGKTRVEKSAFKMDKAAATFAQGFAHEYWDGPTGSMSSGDCYSFRMGGWLWRFDVYRPGLDEKDIP